MAVFCSFFVYSSIHSRGGLAGQQSMRAINHGLLGRQSVQYGKVEISRKGTEHLASWVPQGQAASARAFRAKGGQSARGEPGSVNGQKE